MPHALLAQAAVQPEIPAGLIAGIMALFATLLVFSLLIGLLVAWLIYKPYSKLPREYHTLPPGLCFLLLIPLVNFVMPIILGLKISEAFARYFEATGQSAETGDAGKGVGMWWGISTLCLFVPIVNIVAGVASVVLLILFIVKLWDMAKQIETGGGMTTPDSPTF